MQYGQIHIQYTCNTHTHTHTHIYNNNTITTRMQPLQQTVFSNIGRSSFYSRHSLNIASVHSPFTKFRQQQISSEFELLDFSGKGKLSRKEIVAYLQQKYQWVNMNVLGLVFSSMKWDDDDCVQKDQFVKKYVARQKELHHQINIMLSMRRRVQTQRAIFDQTSQYNPPLYATIRIIKLYLRNNNSTEVIPQHIDVHTSYQDHNHKLSYTLVQPSYELTHSSLPVTLPASPPYFFLSYSFLEAGGSAVLGQTYLNIPIEKEMRKLQRVKLDVKKDNVACGYCQVEISMEDSPTKVDEQIQKQSRELFSVEEKAEKKRKEYQYLQFLWGIRHKSPYKISKLDVPILIAFRLILVIFLLGLSILVHIFGRSEPLSFLLGMYMLQHWNLVLYSSNKFIMLCIGIAALLLDGGWLVFAADGSSQINYMDPSNLAKVLTFALIAIKVLFIFYLLVAEKMAGQVKKIEEQPVKQ